MKTSTRCTMAVATVVYETTRITTDETWLYDVLMIATLQIFISRARLYHCYARFDMLYVACYWPGDMLVFQEQSEVNLRANHFQAKAIIPVTITHHVGRWIPRLGYITISTPDTNSETTYRSVINLTLN